MPLHDGSGPDLLEYAMLVAIIVLFAVIAVTAAGESGADAVDWVLRLVRIL